jgi:hydrogenase nickel incorporation protein HypA/HybF
MHELYIAESILKSVRDSLPPVVLPTSVLKVDVEAGQLDAVIPETLIFLFDAIKASHDMPRAELSVETIPVKCRCRDCSSEFSLDLPIFLCPTCNGGNVEVMQGRGIRLTNITAEDTESS